MNAPYCLQDEEFLPGVVVDHIDGVVAEVLIEENFPSEWSLA